MKAAHRSWHVRLWLLIGPIALVAVALVVATRPPAPSVVDLDSAAGSPSPASGEGRLP